jgi:hypothetical protein
MLSLIATKRQVAQVEYRAGNRYKVRPLNLPNRPSPPTCPSLC